MLKQYNAEIKYSKIYIELKTTIHMENCKVCGRSLTYTEHTVFGELCEECWEKELLKQEKKGERLVKAKI
jgi:hypothetical protein